MDVVIEGRITADEGLGDIIQTVLDLKTVPNAVLRLTNSGDDLQGRIGFGPGGFILGGRVNSTDETGYPAIRKLMTIKEGTYAILDPGRTHVADVNHALWIKATKLIDHLPDLPESPESLLEGGRLGAINTTVEKAQLDPMNLRVSNRGAEGDIVRNTGSKARSFDVLGWRSVRVFILVVGALVVAGLITHYWDNIAGVFPH